ncbi:GSK-3-binding protein FRAT2-like [Gracilinanus agilis]|uniref:GSK-3-binding protein FRAT2-like n=1 Tax=Gracilinanus agilis TaxID=191870 RepID=UPI001CFC8486|nr:GSK-3-binding protein FRAT2-like [Gracilinanus agilis]
MPCRREEDDDDDEAAAAGEEGEEDDDDEGEGEEEESFLVLQQSVTVGGSGDVDRLVAQIGEALQLDAAAAAAGEEGEEDDDDEGEGEEEESFLVLQQSVTVGGSGDVDRLVAQIGEALQLDAAAHGSRPAPRGPLARKQPPPPPPPPPPLRPPVLQLLLPPPPGPAPAPLQPAGPLQCAGSWTGDLGAASHPSPQPPRVPSGPCAPGRTPGRSSAPAPHACKRGFPQPLPGPCRRAWLRGAAASRRLQQQQQHQHHQYRYRGQPGLRAGEDDPHQLLQQLVLSGNLIKEAVRRLRRAVAVVAGAVAPTTPGAGPSFVFAPGGGTDWDGRDSISLQPSTTSLL